MRSIDLIKHIPVALTALVLCGLAPMATADTAPDGDEFIFYPSPPNEPRLQFLTKFSSALDVSAKKKGFRDFVFGGQKNEAQLISKPYGIAVHDGAVYAVDIRGNGYAIFDLANRKTRLVRPSGAGTLAKPINITIDKDGTRYITDTEKDQILVFDAQDRFLRAFGRTGQFRPIDVAIAGDKLYVTDILHHQVHILDKSTGETLKSFAEAGSDEGQLFHPTNLSIANDGTIYVTDTTNFRIQQFDGDGQFIRSIGSLGNRPGRFARPKGVALDREGRIYVVDAAFENIQVLAPEGGALMFFGGPGNDRGNLSMPTAIKIDYDNVEFFQKYAAPNFEIEYLVVVANQFGLNKVAVYGYGSLRD